MDRSAGRAIPKIGERDRLGVALTETGERLIATLGPMLHDRS